MAIVAMSGCGIYKKYETPQATAITRAYAEARSQAPDSTSFGNYIWEDVFTDPLLADYINRALTSNTSPVSYTHLTLPTILRV